MDQDKIRLGATAMGALVVGALTTAVINGSDSSGVPTTLAPIQAGIVRPPSDPEPPKAEPAGPLTTDLDSEIVKPGERVVSSVMLPAGWAPIGDITITGDAVGKFRIIASQLVGREEKVMAENTSDTPVRFTATFSYAK